MSVYEPPWKTILERYLLEFGEGGNVHVDDKGLLNPYGVEEEEGVYMVLPRVMICRVRPYIFVLFMSVCVGD